MTVVVAWLGGSFGNVSTTRPKTAPYSRGSVCGLVLSRDRRERSAWGEMTDHSYLARSASWMSYFVLRDWIASPTTSFGLL